MTLWSFAGLDTKVTERDICDIPSLANLCKPLVFSWCIILEGQRLNRAELLAVGKRHLNPSLSEVNHGDILLSPEVFFNLNHTYNIAQSSPFVKQFEQENSTFFVDYSTIKIGMKLVPNFHKSLIVKDLGGPARPTR